MKKRKWLGLLSLATVASLSLVACGQSDSSSQEKVYSYAYAADPDSLDYTVANRSTTSSVTSNLVDGLLENDAYGNLVPSIAEDWTVSADGLTYTYKLRKDAKWFTADGEEYADVTAQDFVTGLKHAVDSKGEAVYLVEGSIKGLADYASGKEKDFSKVGVKALDDHTVQYTLNQPEPFWNSKTTVGVLFPINAEFLKAQGDKFGTTDPQTLLYNGPFLLKNVTSKSEIEFVKNKGYWDKDAVEIDRVKLAFYDGQDMESLVRNFKDGVYTVAGLYPTSSSYPSVEKEYKDNIIYGTQDATTYFYAFNVNRQSYNHTAKTSDEQKSSTKKAVLNKDFRQAINFAFNRTAYGAQSNGEEGANKIIRNSLVPPTFVQVGDKSFGQVADEKVAELGEQWKGFSSADAQDAFYNKEKASAAFAKAKASLQAEGVTFPIHLDVPVSQTDKLTVARTRSLKQSIEESLGKDNVVIDILEVSDADFNNATYFAQSGNQKDYDFSYTGWEADYLDPASYLDALDPDKGGAIVNLGVDPGSATDVAKSVGLTDYKVLLEEANKETSDLQVRYEKYAAAQAWLTDSGLTVPYISQGGTPSLSKAVPFTRADSPVGSKGTSSNYKLLKLQDKVVTKEEYDKAYQKYLKEKEASNAKAQADLAKHVK